MVDIGMGIAWDGVGRERVTMGWSVAAEYDWVAMGGGFGRFCWWGVVWWRFGRRWAWWRFLARNPTCPPPNPTKPTKPTTRFNAQTGKQQYDRVKGMYNVCTVEKVEKVCTLFIIL